MTRNRQRRLEQLFHAALEQAPERRDAFLEQSCGSDILLRWELESLLAADRGADAFLEGPPLVHRGRSVPPQDPPRTQGL